MFQLLSLLTFNISSKLIRFCSLHPRSEHGFPSSASTSVFTIVSPLPSLTPLQGQQQVLQPPQTLHQTAPGQQPLVTTSEEGLVHSLAASEVVTEQILITSEPPLDSEEALATPEPPLVPPEVVPSETVMLPLRDSASEHVSHSSSSAAAGVLLSLKGSASAAPQSG